ncbi:hypothetical protein J4090_001077 [Salmonella enterica]|nr:hypothetical protein [Salmonella enterica]
MLYVFPAPAGINRLSVDRNIACTGVPRASGDKPVAALAIHDRGQCSPRQRG